MQSNSAAPSQTVQALMAQAILETGSLKNGEEFLVSDLFKGYEWKRIPVRDRLLLGSLFLAESKIHISFSAARKNRANLQVYRKNTI